MTDITIIVSGAPGPQGPSLGVVAASSAIGTLNCAYAVDCSAGAVTITLPAISGVPNGAFVELVDVTGSASTHAITVDAAGTDKINDHGTVEAAYVISNANTITRLTAYNGQWRACQYGA